MQVRRYFDHNATTPLSPEALEALTAALREGYGNASSIHQEGQAAKRTLERARRDVAALLGAGPKDLVFLSGGTEANNLALAGTCTAGDHLITTSIEHPAVLGPCKRLEDEGVTVTYVGAQHNGTVSVDSIAEAIRPNTRLLSVMHANNETGVVQPVAEIGALARERGILFHVDGVQAAGKLDITNLPCDLYTMSAHKLYAPKGIGALYVRPGVKLNAQMLGGHHERDRRAGTENVPGAAAFGATAAWFRTQGQAERERLSRLRDRLEQGILAAIPDTWINGAGAERLPNTTNIGFSGVEGEAMVIALDLRGFAVSSGSACSSGAVEPSHVLLAMGLNREDARSCLRFSLGLSNTEQDVDALIEAVAASARQLRRVSATYTHA